MKKFSVLFLALCACFAFGLVGCSDDDEVPAVIFDKQVTDVSFTDENEEPGKISGQLTWKEPSDVTGITKYVITGIVKETEKEITLGEVAVGTNSFKLENIDLLSVITVTAYSGTEKAPQGASLKDINDNKGPQTMIYFLGSGKFKSNNASIYAYDPAKGEVYPDYFLKQNNRNLGDTGQDMIVYGSKMYIAMYGESTIEVTDLYARSIKQIQLDGSPRALASDGGKVYISDYNGQVMRLDTASLEVEATVKVGRNPEQMAILGGKLYVANSGGMGYSSPEGYDHTVSVVDLASFTETKKIEVALNACGMQSNGKDELYVVSMGDYGAVPNTLQIINTNTDEASMINSLPNATKIAYCDGVLYAIYSQWAASGTVSKYFAYDTNTKATSEWLKENAVPKAYEMCAVGNYVMVSSSDYKSVGDFYGFIKNEQKFKVEAGVNPMKAVQVELY